MKYLLYAVAVTLFTNVADSVAEEDTAELAAKFVAKLHYDNGHTFLDDKDYTSAEQEFDRALISFPEYSLAYLSRAQARYLQQEYDSAIEDFDKYLSDIKDDPDAMFLRGLTKTLTKPEDVSGACADILAAGELGLDLSGLNGIEKYCDGQPGWTSD